MRRLQYYLHIFFRMAKLSLSSDLEYRANYLFRVFIDVIWYLAMWVNLKVLFLHADSIGGWEYPQALAFTGLVLVADALYMVLLSSNLDGFNEKVGTGNLDFALLKPINAQFLLSLQRWSSPSLANLVMAVGILTYAISNLPDAQRSWALLPVALSISLCGLVVLYALKFSLCCLALRFVRAESFLYLYYSLIGFAERPDVYFRPWLRVILWSIFPLAFFASVPAHVLFGESSPGMLLIALLIAGTLLWSTHRLWNNMMRYYTSASS
jgi:ABC-2 type transport system permease protein